RGGGIFNSGLLTVTNTTITGNRADSNNNGIGTGGGLFQDSDQGSTTLRNTIVAGNFPGAGIWPNDDIAGLVTADSNNNLIGTPATSGGLIQGVNGNLVGDGSGGTIDIHTVLDTTLAFNGGPTRTHALVPFDRFSHFRSPAIDAGTSAAAVGPDGNPLTSDQRGFGFPRVIGAAVDIGAYELNDLPVADPGDDYTVYEGGVLTIDGGGS